MAAKLKGQAVVLPKVSLRGAKSATPASATAKGVEIPSDRGLPAYTRDITTLKANGDILGAIREMIRQDGSFSTAAASFTQIAMSGFTVTAYDSLSHQFSPQGTAVAQSVLASFDTLYDYTEGFSFKDSIDSVLETALLEALAGGGLGLELVLNKARLPDRLQVVDMRSLKLISDGKGGYYPQQQVSGGDPIDLDIPTFWMAYTHRQANQNYSRSMLESALNSAFFFQEFVQDVRRTIKKSGMDRLVVILDSEKVANAAPAAARKDQKKLREFMEGVRKDIESQLAAINPEDSIVAFDFAKPEYMKSGQGKTTDYTAMMNTLAGLQASALKAPPSILGLRLEGGSQALGNIESLIFLKVATTIQTPVSQVMSRALTLAVRLYGEDVYVKFKFNPINLRPVDELAAFQTMQTTDTLRKLAFGFITDEEAAHHLGTGPRAPGAPKLSGTMFNAQGGNPNPPASGDTAMGRTLQPDKEVPRAGGGADNDKR